jgi:predicted  nucleic acid-binding Zn-ribbon protein
MEEIEIQEKECADNNLKEQESQKEYKSKEKEFSQRLRELNQEVQSLNEKRLQLSQKVDKDLLRKYNSLRTNLKSRVVAPVIDAVCQGCHLGIPTQKYNELIKGDSPQSCPNCNRIIYWEDNRES